MSKLNLLVSTSTLAGRRFASEVPLVKTAYYDMHVAMGGKMVPFAGYELPVQFEGAGVLKEHLHTRAAKCSSVFDVSHMGQIKWHGKDAVQFLEKMVVGDIAGLKPGEGRLSLIMNEAGGIVDDTIINNAGDHIYMVVNGACKYKDMEHFDKYMKEYKNLNVSYEYLADRQLLALQGPGAAAALGRLAPSLNLSQMNFMTGTVATVSGIPGCRVTRCGYTGEDGFEISVPYKNAVQLAEALFKQDGVKPCGLGARDSLRLEAGLCLYGNDLDETINPVEAGLVWTIGARRRKDQQFLGASKFLNPTGGLNPVAKKRVGIVGMKGPARAHTEIFSPDGTRKIGEVTSGGFGPSFQNPVAMGYVETASSAVDTPIAVSVRGKLIPAKISKMPFFPTSYYKAN